MLDLFHALSLIPDILIGIFQHPRAACVAFVVGTGIAFTVVNLSDPDSLEGPLPPQEVVQEDNEEPKERRIVKVVKWFWKKD